MLGRQKHAANPWPGSEHATIPRVRGTAPLGSSNNAPLPLGSNIISRAAKLDAIRAISAGGGLR